MIMMYITCLITVCSSSFVLSMEKERKQRPQLPSVLDQYPIQSQQQPPYIITTPTTYQTNNQIIYPTNNHMITVMEPGWEKLHEIAYASYTSNAELQPIGYSQQQALQQSSLPQTFVQTNNFGLSHEELIKKMYKKALHLMDSQYGDIQQYNVLGTKLFECVHACNDAKQYDIKEDDLGEFAYKQKEQHADKAALFFGILKRHNEMAAHQKEEKDVPLFDLPPLFAALGIPEGFFEKPMIVPQSMRLLFSGLSKVREFPYNPQRLVTWLYENNALKQNNTVSTNLESNWRTLFVEGAFSLCVNRSIAEINPLLKIIEKAKNSNLINGERDLGYYALDYQTNWTDLASIVISTKAMSSPLSYEDCKYMISLLCIMIENYNDVRKSKNIVINPTMDDLFFYCRTIELGVSLPDRFKNCNDALEAFDNFIKNVKILFSAVRATGLIAVVGKEVKQASDPLYPL